MLSFGKFEESSACVRELLAMAKVHGLEFAIEDYSQTMFGENISSLSSSEMAHVLDTFLPLIIDLKLQAGTGGVA